MINFIKKIFNLKQQINCLSAEEIEILSIPRSGKWRKIRAEHLANNPKCAVCGSVENLVPHHITPVHLDKSKELDENNLITLCENDTFNCHFFFGHYKNWCKYNLNIVEDAKFWQNRINNYER